MLTDKYRVSSCIYKLGSSLPKVVSQSYSAVSIRSSIFELTNSKIRFSAVFLPARNFSKACNTTGPDAVVDDFASYSSV